MGVAVSVGIVVPGAVSRAWGHQQHGALGPRLRQVFQNGELGLVGLMLAISGIWDLQKSEYTSDTIALGSAFLAMTGIMAGAVLVEAYCRPPTSPPFPPRRVLPDSPHLTALVFRLC